MKFDILPIREFRGTPDWFVLAAQAHERARKFPPDTMTLKAARQGLHDYGVSGYYDRHPVTGEVVALSIEPKRRTNRTASSPRQYRTRRTQANLNSALAAARKDRPHTALATPLEHTLTAPLDVLLVPAPPVPPPPPPRLRAPLPPVPPAVGVQAKLVELLDAAGL